MPLIGYPAPVVAGGGMMGPSGMPNSPLLAQMMQQQQNQNPLYQPPVTAAGGIPLSSLLQIAKDKKQQTPPQSQPNPDNTQSVDPYSGAAYYSESSPSTKAPDWLTRLFSSFGSGGSSVKTADGG